MRVVLLSALLGVVLFLCVGCDDETATNPAQAQQTYGAVVDAIDAIPVPAVAAEVDRYVGHPVVIDGRIVGIRQNGCTVVLDAGKNGRLIVDAHRTGDGTCAWRVPAETDGFAVAAGTLRSANDMLRLTANGVRVTPVRLSNPDS